MLDYTRQIFWRPQSGWLQSPINVQTATALASEDQTPRLQLCYPIQQGKPLTRQQNLQFWQPGTAVLNGRSFQFKQVHFHTPSEHQIDGEAFPLEGHFVHQSQTGRLAVIAVFYRLGPANQGLTEVLQGFSQAVECVRFMDLLPEKKSYYHYLGSLTTPPLVENVEWYLLKQRVTISMEQVEELKKRQGENTRLIQPLNDRTIVSFDEV